MKVFLTKRLEGIGEAHTIVELSNGFVRNYIVPNKYGVELNSSNQAMFEKKITSVQKKEEVDQSKKSELFNKLDGLECVFHVTGKDGNLYGSVDDELIVSFLNSKGFKINKKQVLLDKAIKKTGKYEVVIKLSTQLKPMIIVKVVEKKNS